VKWEIKYNARIDKNVVLGTKERPGMIFGRATAAKFFGKWKKGINSKRSKFPQTKRFRSKTRALFSPRINEHANLCIHSQRRLKLTYRALKSSQVYLVERKPSLGALVEARWAFRL